MRRVSSALLIAAVAGCSNEKQITQPRDALARPEALIQGTPNARYDVVKLTSSLGGTANRGNSINNRGVIAGYSAEPGNGTRHAALWREGSVVDLRTLGGPNSNVPWDGQNDHGMVVGISQTAVDDTLGETWSCSAFLPFTGKTCLGFVWQAGVMKPLATLGGDNGFATGVNNRGQVVGWAETRVHDPTCNAPQVLQFRAVMWEPNKDQMRELRPLAGDSTSAATAINEKGQIVGISGKCDVAVGRMSARHAVLWDEGKPIDIGNLGGISWHTPMAINAAGDVVGFSNPPGDTDSSFMAHAFLWTKQRGIRDLGVLKGDGTSQALGINSRGQIVGVSTGPGNRAFLWQDGALTDLNELVELPNGDVLLLAKDINDAGRITGTVFEASSGKTLVFIATPK